MSQRSNPAIIGGFVLGAMALVVVAVFMLAGGSLFERKQRYVMYFENSVFGLQVGSPVVFRGVQIGSVKRVDIRYEPGNHQLLIPVVAESVQGKLLDITGNAVENPFEPTELIAGGLRARLATQSFLTGQLYVELDFFPDKPAVYRSPNRTPDEIPTIPSPVQEIATKLQSIDLERLINDVTAIATSTRQFVSGPELAQTLRNLDGALAALRSASERLDRRIDPLADELARTTRATTAAVQSAQAAMQQVGTAADRFGAVADSAAAPLRDIQGTAEELRRTAGNLRELAGEGVPALHQAGRTMKDLAQAARSLQDLADSLERQPSALLFGKQKPRNQD